MNRTIFVTIAAIISVFAMYVLIWQAPKLVGRQPPIIEEPETASKDIIELISPINNGIVSGQLAMKYIVYSDFDLKWCKLKANFDGSYKFIETHIPAKNQEDTFLYNAPPGKYQWRIECLTERNKQINSYFWNVGVQ